jgi:hypothetical protein
MKSIRALAGPTVLQGFERGPIGRADGQGVLDHPIACLSITEFRSEIGDLFDREPPVVGEHGHLDPGKQFVKFLDLCVSISSSQFVSSFLSVF